MGSCGITMRESDYGLDLLGTIAATEPIMVGRVGGFQAPPLNHFSWHGRKFCVSDIRQSQEWR